MAVETPSAPSRAPFLLLAALLACVAYAAFADGATEIPFDTWVQLALVLAAVVTAGAALYGSSLRIAASPVAWAGLGLLAAFTVWCGLTILWSVAPDRSWEQFNRALGYTLAVALGMVVGTSLPRAGERLAKGLVAIACLVAAFALAAKTVPGLSILGIGFDHAGSVTRLREPLGYWNALALLCVLAAAPALRLAADPEQRRRTRLAAVGAMYLLVVVIGLTYSRGGILALLVVPAIVVALGPQRVRASALFALVVLAAAFPLTAAFTSLELTTNNVPLADREDDALRVLVVFLVAGLVLVLVARQVLGLERSRRVSPERARRVARWIAIAGAVLFALTVLNAARTGAVADLARDFTATKGDAVTDPSRLRTLNSGNRWAWWKEAAGAWSDKPLAGWGAGSFPVTHRMYRRDALGVLQPHNVPLQWLAETGLVGFVLGLGAVLALIAAALSRAQRARGYGVAAGAAGAAWLVHSLFDWDWDIPGVTIPALVLLGVAVARPFRPEPTDAFAAPSGRAPALVAATVLALLAVVSIALPALARSHSDSALATGGAADATPAELDDAVAEAELAARLNPLAAEPLFVAASIEERRRSLPAARRTLLRAIEREPQNVDGWYRLARIEGGLGRFGGALRAIERASELDPLSLQALGLAAQALAALVPPELSATATGAPLPELVPVTDPRPPLGGGTAPTGPTGPTGTTGPSGPTGVPGAP